MTVLSLNLILDIFYEIISFYDIISFDKILSLSYHLMNITMK